MNGIVVLVSLAAIGIDYGWQPLPDGQLEYIVQIEPDLLEELKGGEEIVSEIVPEARNVRRLRIRVGTGDVPRVGHGRSDTASRNLGSTNSGGGSGYSSGKDEFSVLPPQPESGSAPATRGDESPGNFGPEGFLNLPPPPPLLDPDGKKSVMVPPGSGSREAKPSAGGPQDVLPPDVSGPDAGSSPPDRAGTVPPADRSGSSTSDGTAGPSKSPAAGTLNPPQFGGSVYPPSTGANPPPSGGSSGMVLPPTGESASDWPGEGTSRSSDHNPVREPRTDAGQPNPIRVGESGVQAPGAKSEATHGPEHPPSASRQEPSSRQKAWPSGREEELLAKNTNGSEPHEDSQAAAFKPSMDKETAESIEPKPWTPLVLTSLALFASLAANAYLGWVALGIYRRYRDIVSQLHQAQTSVA